MGLVGGAGNEYFYNGRNHPGPATYNDQLNGLWRLEESAPLTADTYFLNVMYATDAATASMPAAQVVEETADRVTCVRSTAAPGRLLQQDRRVDWGFGELALDIATTSLPDGTVGRPIRQTVTAVGGTAPYTWSVSGGSAPDGTRAQRLDGRHYRDADASKGHSSFTVAVEDSQSTPATETQALQIVVAAVAPTITTAALAGGTEGAAYSQTLAAAGGIAPYRWYVFAGALPSGPRAQLAARARFRHVPFVSGTFSFTVKAWDTQAARHFDTQALTLTCRAPPTRDGDGLADGWEMEHSAISAQARRRPRRRRLRQHRRVTATAPTPRQARRCRRILRTSQWTSVGPGGGGAQYNPTPAPNNPDLMFGVCDMGGFYRSTDGGRHWTMVSGKDVNLVPIVPGYRLRAGVPSAEREPPPGRRGSIGLVRSTDAGITFTKVSDVSRPRSRGTARNQTVAFFAGGATSSTEAATAAPRGRRSPAGTPSALDPRALRRLLDDGRHETVYASTAAASTSPLTAARTGAPANTGLANTDVDVHGRRHERRRGCPLLRRRQHRLQVHRRRGHLDGRHDGAAGRAVTMAPSPPARPTPTSPTSGSSEAGGPTVYKTTDGGANWTLKLISPSSGRFPVTTTVERDWVTLGARLGLGRGPSRHRRLPDGFPRSRLRRGRPDLAFQRRRRLVVLLQQRGDGAGSNWWTSTGFETTNAYGYDVDPRDATRHYIPYTDMGFFAKRGLRRLVALVGDRLAVAQYVLRHGLRPDRGGAHVGRRLE